MQQSQQSQSQGRASAVRSAFYFPGAAAPTGRRGRAAEAGLASSPSARIGRVEPLEGRRLLTAVTAATIYNTDTDQPIRDLRDGDTIDYAELGTTHITVVAKTDSSTASVKFGYDGNDAYRVESSKPFAINGDLSGNLQTWAPSLGSHTLTVRPYAEAKAAGTAGSRVTIDFTVKNGGGGGVSSPSPTPTPSPVPSPAPASNDGDSSGGAGNQQPRVTLGETPLGTYAGPAYVLLRATASDPDGDVTKVEWYANGQYLGAADAAPYMFAWREVPPGTYEVTAKAYDDDGGSKTSAAGTVKVLPLSGRTYHVAKDGSDSGSGSSSSPFKTIKRAQSAANAGDTIAIHSGTYKEEIRLKKSGTSDKPITITAADGPGTVTIDGSGNQYLAVPDYDGAGKWTTIIGLTFKNANNNPGQTTSAVKTADGWRLIDCHVENVSGAAVGAFGKNVVLVRVSAEDNGCTGIGGSRLSNAMVLDCVSHHNNTDNYSGGYEGGGGKFTKVDGLLVDGHHAYDNNGPGIWFDIGNVNVAIKNGEFHDNHNLYRDDGSEKIGGRGVFFEISGIIADGSRIAKEGPMLVEDNAFWDNEHAGVDVYATANATVRDNTFLNDYINLKDKRPEPFLLRDLTIRDNRFKNGFVIADTATVKNYRSENFDIDHNTYDNGGSPIFNWDGKKYTSLSSVFSSLGFEKNGDFANLNL